MKIDISDQAKKRFAIQDSVHAHLFEESDEISASVAPSGLSVQGEIRRLPENQFQINFELTGKLSYPCSRCLEPVELDCHYSFEDVIETSEDFIDLNPYVLDCLYIHEPTKVLCREDCRGLCQHCGANLNETTCSCEQEDFIDPRMEALQSLL